jgi:drug/metabolite transporter (DMT)-like permease
MNKFNVGVVLLILGVALLLFGGFSYTTQDKTSIGPITIEHPEEHHLPYSPIAGVLLGVTGAVLMVGGRAPTRRLP